MWHAESDILLLYLEFSWLLGLISSSSQKKKNLELVVQIVSSLCPMHKKYRLGTLWLTQLCHIF